MYSRKTNVVIGFYGCDVEIRDQIVNHQIIMKPSEKEYDWLGHGMYFLENDFERAMKWAEDNKKKPAVLGAIIDLDYCLDFLESKNLSLLRPAYETYCKVTKHQKKTSNPKIAKSFYCGNLIVL